MLTCRNGYTLKVAVAQAFSGPTLCKCCCWTVWTFSCLFKRRAFECTLCAVLKWSCSLNTIYVALVTDIWAAKTCFLLSCWARCVVVILLLSLIIPFGRKAWDTAQLLLSLGADVNRCSRDSVGREEPPLCTACRLGSLDIARTLLRDPGAHCILHFNIYCIYLHRRQTCT